MNKFSNFKNIFLGIFFSLITLSFASAAITPIENIQIKQENDKLIVTWNAVAGAAFYKVFNKETGQLFENGNVGNKTTYTLNNAETGKKYQFAIRAYKAGASDYFAGGDAEFTVPSSNTQSNTQSNSPASSEQPVQVGAPFPNEPERVTLIDHIYYAHKWASGVGSLLAVFMIIFAAFKYTTSTGNPEALQDAKDTMIGAIIGLSIIILTYLLLQIVGIRVIKE